ncbi:E3 ubiquitin-protein ligase RNF19A-like [Nilaparvata lugens]|uniref:E3 ubiquitin-protein ligase RNF19A-like n=1 Tax=Nilaparvata lugens TaxID=108931 RepID=UPI00193C945D|nr:E3 ubiquitin-protein ligase RNF19A-like [Nilaparvata lugens]
MTVMANKPNDGDTVSHPGGNPSIGEVSLSLGSGSQLGERDADRESASLAGLTGSIAGANRLDVQAEVASSQRLSMSSETASATTSLSLSEDKSLADDGAASTRALAGSVLNFKIDNGSLSNYRTATGSSSTEGGGATPTPCAGDLRNDPLEASLSSLEELASGLMRRVARRRLPLDRQTSDSGDEVGLERVRFDDNVSFIDAERGHCKSSRKHNSSSEPSASGANSSRTVSSLRSLFFHQLAESRSNAGSNQAADIITSGAPATSGLPAILEPSSLSADAVVISIPQA